MPSEDKTLSPDKGWLGLKLRSLRNPTVVYPQDETDRLRAELSLLEVNAQERYIKALEDSIESQDKLSKTQNFLAWAALFLAFVEIMVSLIPYI